jgi:GR25 family glycosyltransferase involved in LPS biosynthesis
MYQGFFINLQRNEQRRKALLLHLEEVGAAARYQPFEAVDGQAEAPHYSTPLDPGSLGLWLSDLKLLNGNRSTGVHLHIIEDDTVLVRNAVPLFDAILNTADTQLAAWDVLFTDILIWRELSTFVHFSRKAAEWQGKNYTLFDLENISFGCTSSFFVNRSSVGKLADLLGDNWRIGAPIDLFLRRLVKQRLLKAFVTLPFMTSLSSDCIKSDIRGALDRSRRVCNVYRRAFFVEANLEALREEMHALVSEERIAPMTQIYLDMLSFTLTDQFVWF